MRWDSAIKNYLMRYKDFWLFVNYVMLEINFQKFSEEEWDMVSSRAYALFLCITSKRIFDQVARYWPYSYIQKYVCIKKKSSRIAWRFPKHRKSGTVSTKPKSRVVIAYLEKLIVPFLGRQYLVEPEIVEFDSLSVHHLAKVNFLSVIHFIPC